MGRVNYGHKTQTEKFTELIRQASVSIITIIPAFKNQYIEDVLLSLERQTIQPDKIIFSDDSPDRSVLKKIESFLDGKSEDFQAKIILTTGPRQGAHANISNLLDEYVNNSYKYFHILFDDDVLSEKFYEMHLYGLEKYDLGISINKRHFIDTNQRILNINQYPGLINMNTSKFLVLDKLFLYKSIIPSTTNWLGENSNCIASTRLKEIFKNMSFGDNIIYCGLGDVGGFLSISDKESLIFINEYLSGYRQSPHQNTSNLTSETFQAGLWAWVPISIHGYKLNLITENEFQESLIAIKNRIKAINKSHKGILDEAFDMLVKNDANSKEFFISQWNNYLSSFGEGKLVLKLNSIINSNSK